jgi:hypothetical protein
LTYHVPLCLISVRETRNSHQEILFEAKIK